MAVHTQKVHGVHVFSNAAARRYALGKPPHAYVKYRSQYVNCVALPAQRTSALNRRLLHERARLAACCWARGARGAHSSSAAAAAAAAAAATAAAATAAAATAATAATATAATATAAATAAAVLLGFTADADAAVPGPRARAARRRRRRGGGGRRGGAAAQHEDEDEDEAEGGEQRCA